MKSKDLFLELARCKFFYHSGKKTSSQDVWIYFIMENVADNQNQILGKFKTKDMAMLFLETIRRDFIVNKGNEQPEESKQIPEMKESVKKILNPDKEFPTQGSFRTSDE